MTELLMAYNVTDNYECPVAIVDGSTDHAIADAYTFLASLKSLQPDEWRAAVRASVYSAISLCDGLTAHAMIVFYPVSRPTIITPLPKADVALRRYGNGMVEFSGDYDAAVPPLLQDEAYRRYRSDTAPIFCDYFMGYIRVTGEDGSTRLYTTKDLGYEYEGA